MSKHYAVDRPPHPALVNPALRRSSGARGSLSEGFGLFSLCLVGGGFLTWRLAEKLAVAYADTAEASYLYPALAPLPLLLALFLGVGLAWTGRTRTALGMLLGFGCAATFGLLLIAVCTGFMPGLGSLRQGL